MTNFLLIAAIHLSALPAQPHQYDQAYRRSITSGQPLVVLLGADWCPGCKTMKAETLPKVAKAGGLAKVEFAYVDIDRQRRLAGELFRANAIPQLIRFRKTPAGWESQHLIGVHSAEQVRAFVNTGAIRNPGSERSAPGLSSGDG